MTGLPRPLADLADAHGLVTDYTDGLGRARQAGVDTVVAVLAALGVDVPSPDKVDGLADEVRLERAARLLEPVVVAWDGRLGDVRLSVAGAAPAHLDCSVVTESGECIEWRVAVEDLPVHGVREVAGVPVTTRLLDGPRRLPLGEHRLTVVARGRTHSATVLAAPVRPGGAGRSTAAGAWWPPPRRCTAGAAGAWAT